MTTDLRTKLLRLAAIAAVGAIPFTALPASAESSLGGFSLWDHVATTGSEAYRAGYSQGWYEGHGAAGRLGFRGRFDSERAAKEPDYIKGYQEGYKAGYKRGAPGSISDNAAG